jgi:type VI secretion system Hcp family effector
MTDLTFKLTRIGVTGVLAGAVAAALVLPGGATRAPVKPVPTNFWSAFSLAAANADAIYLQVSGFTGGESDEQHLNYVTANTVDSGVTNNGQPGGSKGGGGAGKAVPQQLVVTKPVDQFTPQFNHATSRVQLLRNVTLSMSQTGAGDTPYDSFQISADNVIVQLDHVAFSTGQDSVETVRMGFTKLTWTYQHQDDGGTTQFTSCWDFAANRDCTPRPPTPGP